MGTLDPRLRHLLRTLPDVETGAETAPAFAECVGWEPDAAQGTVQVLVELRTDTAGLPGRGTTIETVADGEAVIHVARVPVDGLVDLAADDAVTRVEASRPLYPELDISRGEVRADPAHGAAPPMSGAGTIVAIIDGGIDYTHRGFRNADGTSRILFLWDQAAPAPSSRGLPVPYGVEWTKADLDQALQSADPIAVVPHQDHLDSHGTHVAGIAAGNGRERADRSYAGVAPGADLIVVALASISGVTLGRSDQLVSAVDYVLRRAGSQPVAINISQGMNGGGHSGETLVERALDAAARRAGVVLVKSAGNEGGWGSHAGGQMQAGGTVVLDIVVPAGDQQDDAIEIWYSGDDRIGVRVEPPTGLGSVAALPGDERELRTSAGNLVEIANDVDPADIGDNACTITISRGSAGQVQSGTWRIILAAEAVVHGRFDAWIERAPRGGGGREQARFAAGSADPSRTISIPGTASRIITVGSYITRTWIGVTSGFGTRSSFSSEGPTRLGAHKPEICAPGETISSARGRNSVQPFGPDAQHTLMAGTSMAAPHVAGAAALMLSVRPTLRCEEVQQLMERTARRDGRTAGAPDDRWGAGKIDVAAAVDAARTATFPTFEAIVVTGTRVEVSTDVPASVTLRFHTSAQRLAAGKVAGQLSSPVASVHQFDLSSQPAGAYVCEVVATAGGLWTRDDRDGAFYAVTVLEAGAAQPVPPGVDELETIKGIGRVVATLLRSAGITTFVELARRSPEELAAIAHSARVSADRVIREDWIGQAATLAAGGSPSPPSSTASRARHSFTVALTTDPSTNEALSCEIVHHQSNDSDMFPGWHADRVDAFVRDRAHIKVPTHRRRERTN